MAVSRRLDSDWVALQEQETGHEASGRETGLARPTAGRRLSQTATGTDRLRLETVGIGSLALAETDGLSTDGIHGVQRRHRDRRAAAGRAQRDGFHRQHRFLCLMSGNA